MTMLTLPQGSTSLFDQSVPPGPTISLGVIPSNITEPLSIIVVNNATYNNHLVSITIQINTPTGVIVLLNESAYVPPLEMILIGNISNVSGASVFMQTNGDNIDAYVFTNTQLTIQSGVVYTLNTLNYLQNTTSSISQSILQLSNTVQGLETTIANYGQLLTTIQSDQTTTDELVNSQNNSIATMESTVTQVNGSVSALTAVVNQVSETSLKASSVFSNFIVNGVQWAIPSPASLTSTMSGGEVYLNGLYTTLPAISRYAFMPNSDTYVSFNNAGDALYQSVNSGDTPPIPTSGYVQTAKVVAASIISPAPTLTTNSSGSLSPGTYLGALVVHDATGYGTISPTSSIVVGPSGAIIFNWINPINETSVDIYVSTNGSTTLGLVAIGITGTTYTYTGNVAPGSPAPLVATSNAVQRVTNWIPVLNDKAALVVTPEMFGGTDYAAFNSASDWLWANNYGGQIYISSQYYLGEGNVNLAPNVSIVGCLHGAGDVPQLLPNSSVPAFHFPSCLIVDSSYTINIGIGGSIANCYIISAQLDPSTGVTYAGTAITSLQYAYGDYVEAGSPSVQNVFVAGFQDFFISYYTQRVHITNINLDCYNGVTINHSHDICRIQGIHAWVFFNNDSSMKGTLVTINGGTSSWHEVIDCFSLYWYTTVWLNNTGNVTVNNCKNDGAYVGSAGPGVSFLCTGEYQGTNRFIGCKSTAATVFSIDVTNTPEGTNTVIIDNLDIWGPNGNGMFNIANGYVIAKGINLDSGRSDVGTIGNNATLKFQSSTLAVGNNQLPPNTYYESYGNLTGWIGAFEDMVLPNDAYGKAIQVSVGVNVTLPTMSGYSGQTIYFYGQGGPYTITSNSDQFIYAPQLSLGSTTGPITLTVPDGGTVLLMARGGSEFDIIGGSVCITNAYQCNFQGSISQSASAGANNQTPFLQYGDTISTSIINGTAWSSSSNSLIGAMSSGLIAVNNQRTIISAIDSYTFPPSSDTYVSFNNNGDVDYQSVANGATAPILSDGYQFFHKVVSSSTSIEYVEIQVPIIGLSYSYTYEPNLPLYLPPNSYLVGTGASSTITFNGVNQNLLVANSAGNCLLENFSLYCNNPTAGQALTLNSSGNVTSLNIQGSYNGIAIGGPVSLRGNIVSFENQGIILNGAVDTAITQHTNTASSFNAGATGINLVMNGNCQGIIVSDSEFLGGEHGMVVTPESGTLPVTQYSNGPAFNRFTNVYFDSSASGADIDWSTDTIFTACWFSNRPGNGATVGTNFSQGIQFIGCTFENSGSHGLEIGSGASTTTLIGCLVKGNNTENNGSYGIYVADNTIGFTISHCVITSLLGSSAAQTAAIYIGTGCDDYVIEGNYLLGNGATLIDNSRYTATNRAVRNNIGYDEYDGLLINPNNPISSGSITLSPDQSGSIVVWSGTENGTITMPLAESSPINSMKFVITNVGSASLSIALQGSDGTDLPSMTVFPGQQISLVNVDSNVWRTIWQTNGNPNSPYLVGNASNNTEAVNLGQANSLYQSSQLSVSSTTTAGSITATASQLVGGYLADGATQTAAFTITTDTAANILAAMPNAAVGTSFKFRFINNDQSSAGYVGTLAGGSGVTVGTSLPNPAIGAGEAMDYLFTFTAIGSSPAISVEAVLDCPIINPSNLAGYNWKGPQTIPQALINNLSGTKKYFGITTDTTLTSEQAGSCFIVAGGATITIPSIGAGAEFEFIINGPPLGTGNNTASLYFPNNFFYYEGIGFLNGPGSGSSNQGYTFNISGPLRYVKIVQDSGGNWNCVVDNSFTAFPNQVLATSNLAVQENTVVNGPTSGTVTVCMPLQGSGGKQVILTFDAYENDTTTNQTIDFPVTFSVVPLVLGNNTGLTLTVSTTGVTITAPDSTTTYSGTAAIIGN